MVHIVMYADGTKQDDIAVADWKLLLTSESEYFASKAFNRYCLKYKACLVLWVQAEDGRAFGVKAYCNRFGVTEFSQGLMMPKEIVEARDVIARALSNHGGVNDATHFTSAN